MMDEVNKLHAIAFSFILAGFILTGPASLNGQKTGYVNDHASGDPGPGNVYLQNFDTQSQGGQGQNWAVVQDPRGLIYAGNNEGVLEYDGVSWRLIPVSNFSIARSLGVDRHGKVFVGAQEQIGYLEPDADGMLQYRSLLEQVPEADRELSDVWKTVVTSRGVYFSTRERLLRWSGDGSMQVWRAETHFRKGWNVRDTFYISQGDIGLVFVGEDDVLRPIPGGDCFADLMVNAVLPAGEDRLLVATGESGLFLQDGDHFVPWPTGADDYLKEHLLTDAEQLAGGSLALSTLYGGVVILDPWREPLHIIDESSGLRSNMVICLETDREGGLWAVLGDGLARIEAQSPLTVHADGLGVKGPVYTIARHEGHLYLGSLEGIYVSTAERARGETFRMAPDVSAECLALLSTGCGLLAGTNAGVYRMTPEQTSLIPYTEAVYCLSQSRYDPGRVWLGQRSGLAMLELRDETWTWGHQVDGVTEHVRCVVEEDEATVWLGTDFEGVLRVRFSEGWDAPPTSVERFGPENGLPEKWSRIFLLDGDVLIGTQKGLYRPETGSPEIRFVHDARLGPAFADSTMPVYDLEPAAGGNLWCMSGNDVGLIRGYSSGSPVWDAAPLCRATSGETFKIFPDADGVLWVGRTDGLVRYDPGVRKDYAAPFTALVRRVTATRSQTLVHGGFDGNGPASLPRLSSEDRDLRFEVAAATFDDVSRNNFRFFLEGYDEGWSEWTGETNKDYTNLPGGHYAFRVQARNVYGHVGDEAVLRFAVDSPWFATWWALGLFGLGAVAVIYGLGAGLNNYRLSRLEAQVSLRTAQLARTVEELAAEKEQLAVTLRSIGDAVVTIDTEGRVVLLNRVAEDLTRSTQQEAAGKPFGDVFHIIDEKTGERCTLPVEKIIEGGKTSAIGLCTILIDEDGTERTMAYSGAPVYNPKSEVIGIVLVLRDITEARKMEEERQKMQKLESVGHLAGGIAHDFNNVLTGILINIELAKNYAEGSRKVIDKLTNAETASLRAQALTKQLLTFSRGGAPVKEAGYLTGLLKKSVEFALTGSNIQCKFSLQEDLWPVVFDAGQISQVIHNLVINADQAMPQGGTIQVRANNVVIGAKKAVPLEEGKYVKICIEDQGIGISKQHIQKIFDPFFTTKEKGSGLGLATSYSIIRNHGGYIGVESELDVGTTFHIYLPASEEKILEKEKEAEKFVAGQEKILVMDDEEIIRNSLTEILEEAGYRVESAKHGTEAVRLYKKALEKGEAFDVVILDLTVKGGTGGKEALQELLKIDPRIKAIVASGYSTAPVMSEFRQYGFSGCIVKPYKISDLHKTIKQVFSGVGPR